MENHWSVTGGQSDLYKPENLHVSLFGTVLSISDNTIHYQINQCVLEKHVT